MTKLKSKNGTPVLPGKSNFVDPCKQGKNRGRALRDTRARYKRIADKVSRLVRKIPRAAVNNDGADYEYLVDADYFSALVASIGEIVGDELLEVNNNGNVWAAYYTDLGYEGGTADALQSAKNVTPASVAGLELSSAVRSLNIDNVKYDPGYIRRVALVRARMFEFMKGLTDTTRSDLSSTLAGGMKAGDGINKIVRDLKNRVSVSYSRATRIVRTEINQAYREANLDETTSLNNEIYKESDYELRSLWFSALAATTRPTHAKRHGKAYTISEVKKFYGRDANAINCYCSQSATLVNKKTGEIMQSDLQARMKKQRDEFSSAEQSS